MERIKVAQVNDPQLRKIKEEVIEGKRMELLAKQRSKLQANERAETS